MSHRHVEIKPEELQLPKDHSWAKLPMIGAGLAVLGAVLLLAMGRGDNAQRAFHSFHVAFSYVTTIGIGCLFFVLFQHASSAGWSITMRRLAENVAGTLPLTLPLFFIVLFLGGMNHLFPWAAGTVPHHAEALVEAKSGYLNVGFFTGRALFFIAVFVGLSLFFLRRSVAQDAAGDAAISAKLRKASYPAIIIFVMSLHFSSLDWLKSMSPAWFSTMWGVYIFAGCAVSAFALLSLLTILVRKFNIVPENILTIEHLHDIGKLTFAFVVFWAYIGFFQYFLIWYAGIPEETFWYRERMVGGWSGVTMLLAVGHFVIPFFYLMSRHIKRNPVTMGIGAVWILLMHYVDLYWIIMPNLDHSGPHFGLLDIAALLLFEGLMIAGFGFWLTRHAVVPVKDPRLQESIAFENF